MPFNKISGGSVNYPGYPIGMTPGAVLMLPPGQSNPGAFGSVNLPQLGVPKLTLTGQYTLDLGLYSVLQVYDSSLNYWRSVARGGPNGWPVTISADGYNYRVVNTTGCPVGAVITTNGSGGIAGFYGYQEFGPGSQLLTAVTIQNGLTSSGNTLATATASSGGSLWNLMIGGSVNTTISVSGTVYQNGPYSAGSGALTASGGSSYTAPPFILFFPPPNQGAQPYFLPSAYCTLSAGAVNAVTVLNQGAGLLGLPGIAVIPQPGDNTGSGAVLGWTSSNYTDPNAGALTALWPASYGSALTAVPTFTFAGTNIPTSAAATALMDFTITSITTGTAGVGYGTTPGAVIFQGISAASSDITNPALDKWLNSGPVAPPLNVATSTGTGTLAGPFQGYGFQAIPKYCAIPNGTAAPSTANASTVVVGGAQDVIYLRSF